MDDSCQFRAGRKDKARRETNCRESGLRPEKCSPTGCAVTRTRTVVNIFTDESYRRSAHLRVRLVPGVDRSVCPLVHAHRI